jgi:hypothetical protein
MLAIRSQLIRRCLMATAVRLPERDPLYEARAAQRLRVSHSPETLERVVRTKPPKGQPPILIFEFHLLPERRPDKSKAPCPICSPISPKYFHGALAWFPEEHVYRCIGIECIGRLVGDEVAYRIRKDLRDRKSLDADYEFVFENLPRAPQMKAYLECLLPAAEHAEKLRDSLGRAHVRTDLWKLLKDNGGELVVWEDHEIERLDPRTNTTRSIVQRTRVKYGLIQGHMALANGIKLMRDLRIKIQNVEAFCLPDSNAAQTWALNAHDKPGQLVTVRKMLIDAKRFKDQMEGKIRGVLTFFNEGNGLTDILYQRHRETIASRPPDLEAAGLG